MLRSREEKVAIILAKEIVDKYSCECKVIQDKGNNYLYLFNKKIDVLLTVCNTNKKRVIKVEEILINKKYRNKGICTNLINTMKNIVLENDVTLGLWCELDNKKLFNFYSRMGFKYVETLNDDWLEFN